MEAKTLQSYLKVKINATWQGIGMEACQVISHKGDFLKGSNEYYLTRLR